MLRSKYIRLFVSSTFEDMQIERNILQSRVFPRITELCNSHGWQFEDIDLRWGISQEASRMQKTMHICLNEIKNCQKLSPKPNFLILQGDRYGWIPLPEVIPYNDGCEILGMARKEEIELFNQWYLLDTNSYGDGEYILQPRTGKYRDLSVYVTEIETSLRSLFNRYARCQKDVEKKMRYSASATEQEVYCGALSVNDASEHVVLYSRTMTGVPNNQKAIYGDSASSFLSFLRPKSRQSQLKELLIGSLKNVIEKKLSYKELATEKYAEEFEQSVYSYLERIVLNEIQLYSSVSDIEYDIERSLEFIRERNSFFVGREREVEYIVRSINEHDGRPIVLTGPSGVGKSSLLSKVISDFSTTMTVISRFVGYSSSRNSGLEILRSIWNEMDNYCTWDKDFSLLEFAERIRNTKCDNPLLVVIDGIDQLDEKDELCSMNWLPNKLEGNVMLLYSVLDRAEYQHLIPNDANLYRLEPFCNDEAMAYVDLKMSYLRRSLTSEQYNIFKDAVKQSDKLPVYLNLVTYYASHLHSYDKAPAIHTDAKKILLTFFDELAKDDNHGETLVKKVLSYMISVKYGISHMEIRELLARDKEYWCSFLEMSKHDINEAKTPSVIVIRLLSDLCDFISQQDLFDTVLIHFNHRILYEAAYEWLKLRSAGYAYPELFGYYDSKWKIDDPHAMYEVSHIALKMCPQVAFDLFTNLDYLMAKIKHSASDVLRHDIYKAEISISDSSVRNQLEIFREFDAEAKAYVTSLNILPDAALVREAVLGLAANWAKGSVVRKSFESSRYSYPSMLNSISQRDYTLNSFRILPISFNGSSFISDDGMVIFWLQGKRLMKYSYETSEVLHMIPELELDQFRITSDMRTIVGVNDDCLFIYDMTMGKSFVVSAGCGGLRTLTVSKDSDGYVCVSYLKESNLYIFKCLSLETRERYTYSDQLFASATIEGFMNHGKWIVLKHFSLPDSVGNIERIMVTAYEYGQTLTDKGTCSYPFLKQGSPYNIQTPLIISTSLDTTIVSSSGNYLTLHDYSSGKLELDTLKLFNNIGHAPTYGLHISEDGDSVVAISGDSRLVYFDVRKKKIRNVYNMPEREHAYFIASGNNEHLLLSVHMGRNCYNQILDTSKMAVSIDYFPSSLTTMSSDIKANTIFTSHGTDWQHNAEGPTLLLLDNGYVNRKIVNDCEVWNNFYTMSTGVSMDGSRIAYARGLVVDQTQDEINYLPIPAPEHDPGKGDENDVMWYFVTHLEYTPDNSALLAVAGRPRFHGESSRKLYLYLTGPDGHLKSFCQYLRLADGGCYHYDYASISQNGQYALVWADCYSWRSDGRNSMMILSMKDNLYPCSYHSMVHPVWFPDSIAFAATVKDKTNAVYSGYIHSYVKDEGKSSAIKHSGTNVIIWDVSYSGRKTVAVNYSDDSGCRIIYTFGGITIGELVKLCKWCPDDIHLFVICQNHTIYLVDTESDTIVQKFKMCYYSDRSSSRFSSNSLDLRLYAKVYSKGLLISDGDHIFRIEPDGYKINKVSFATISRVWNHRTDEFDEPKALCPMCGKRFVPDSKVLECIENICKDLPSDVSPCLNLKFGEWEKPELKGHTCPHCGNQLRFNPFIG